MASSIDFDLTPKWAAPTASKSAKIWQGARTFWTATGQIDSVWYQLRNPAIGGLQQLVNCAAKESELLQMCGTLALLAERSLRALRCSKNIRCSLENLRSYWSIPLADFPPLNSWTHPEVSTFARCRQKVLKIASVLCLIVKNCFVLAMTLVDMRQTMTWDEQQRKDRARNLIVDIARLCESIRNSRQELRGEQESLNRHLQRIKAPFVAKDLISLFDHIDQIENKGLELQKVSKFSV